MCLLFSVCTAGCRLLQDLDVSHVEVDGCGDAQSAAEGAALGLFQYDQLKSKKKTKVTTRLHGRWTEACSHVNTASRYHKCALICLNCF